jgi:hypothetical protein
VLVVWAAGQADAWILLTTLPPATVGPGWYGARMWIELGFRALKSLGWHWERAQRTDPDRVARHWLVLAVAPLWTVAAGTWLADAAPLGLPPLRRHAAPAAAPPARASLVRLGLGWILVALIEGWSWDRGRLTPAALPEPLPDLHLIRHAPAASTVD